jgi:hypothetical protein
LKLNEPLRLLYRQGMQQDVIQQAEDSSIRANPQGYRHHCHGGEHRGLGQRPDCVPKIADDPHIDAIRPAASFCSQ